MPSSSAPIPALEIAVQRYLALLAGEAPESEFLELRYRVGADRFASEFHAVHDRPALSAAVLDRGRRTDVYVGCAPRTARRGTKDSVGKVWTLWAECDGELAARRLQAFRPRPALV